MLKQLLLLGLFYAVQGSHGETCYTTEYSWWYDSYYTNSFYCDQGCCGTVGYQYCCTYHGDHDGHKDSDNDHDDDHHHKGGWTVASIVGVSLGCLVSILAVGIIVVCTVKACKAGNKKVVNVQPSPAGMHVWSTSTGTPPTVHGFTQPPTYTPMGAFQSQPPVYHPAPGPARYDFNTEKQGPL